MASSSTKYFKVVTRIVGARDSSFTDTMFDETYTDEWSYSRHIAQFELLADTGGTATVDLSAFTNIDDVIIRNRDAANFVDVEYDNTPGSVNIDTRIEAGRMVRLGSTVSVSGDLTFTADSADCEVVVTVIGD